MLRCCGNVSLVFSTITSIAVIAAELDYVSQSNVDNVHLRIKSVRGGTASKRWKENIAKHKEALIAYKNNTEGILCVKSKNSCEVKSKANDNNFIVTVAEACDCSNKAQLTLWQVWPLRIPSRMQLCRGLQKRIVPPCSCRHYVRRTSVSPHAVAEQLPS
ncbi:unnamed protein product [Cylicocyclus nassatus]|uniref:Uncharacterized protein n=1 Tax=Cylicocyclus nassatus TaxID=53992 RepID=A0AA36GU89_CYLNA|nr:unnamed protein product [Cylicocyclus nassatus]